MYTNVLCSIYNCKDFVASLFLLLSSILPRLSNAGDLKKTQILGLRHHVLTFSNTLFIRYCVLTHPTVYGAVEQIPLINEPERFLVPIDGTSQTIYFGKDRWGLHIRPKLLNDSWHFLLHESDSVAL